MLGGYEMIYAVIAVSFFLLVGAVMLQVPLEYPLLIILCLFALFVRKKGYNFRKIGGMMLAGIKKSMVVIWVLLIISALTASWMSAGTIPYLVNLGIGFIQPQLFVLFAFLFCCALSYLLGSSFATANTLGVVLMAIARSSGVNLYLTAGAIVCGIYFGDRVSPMSSSLALLSSLTKSDHYANARLALKTGAVPLLLSSALFGVFSLLHPMGEVSSTIPEAISSTFYVDWMALLPAAVVLLLCLLRVNVKLAMGASTLCAGVIAVMLQGRGIGEFLKTLVMGFYLPQDSVLYQIIQGGGVVNMLETVVIVLVSCAVGGLFEGADLIQDISFSSVPATRLGKFMRTVLCTLATSAVGCNQTIAIVMTAEMVKGTYRDMEGGQAEMTRDLLLTTQMLPTAIPWNIAVFMPLVILGIPGGVGHMPYLFLPYFMVLCPAVAYWFKDRRTKPAAGKPVEGQNK